MRPRPMIATRTGERTGTAEWRDSLEGTPNGSGGCIVASLRRGARDDARSDRDLEGGAIRAPRRGRSRRVATPTARARRATMTARAKASIPTNAGPPRRVSPKRTRPTAIDTKGFTRIRVDWDAAKGPTWNALCMMTKDPRPATQTP